MFIPYFSGSASAERVSAIEGINPSFSGGSWTDFEKMFDGDTSTFAKFVSPKSGPAPYVTWTMPEPVTIDAFVLNGYVSDKSPYNQIYITVYQGNTSNDIANLGYSRDSLKDYDNSIHVLSTPIPGVTKIMLKVGQSGTGTIYQVSEFKVLTTKLTENPEPEKFKISNLKVTLNSTESLNLSWDAIKSDYLKTYQIYQNNKLLGSVKNTSYFVNGLSPGEEYTFKIVPVDTFDKDYAPGVISYTIPIPDTTPPAVPQNVKVSADQKTAHLTWDAVTDEDLYGYFVYLGDSLLTKSAIRRTTFDMYELEPDKEYTVSVSAVDLSGNESEKSKPVTFKTLGLDAAPSKPAGIEANLYNGAVMLFWKPVDRAKEYKVYQDGNEIKKTSETSAKIENLENGRLYTFEVSALNQIGESEKSDKVTLMPSAAHLPFINLGYDLKDVSEGTSSWFSSIWLILAFVVAIFVAFFVGRHLKSLFGGG